MKTTNEMLEEFSYLGAETAYKVVVENTNLIAEMCEEISPVPKGMFPPELKGSAEVTALTYARRTRFTERPFPGLSKSASSGN